MRSRKIILIGLLIALLWWLALFAGLIRLWWGEFVSLGAALVLVLGLALVFALLRLVVKTPLPSNNNGKQQAMPIVGSIVFGLALISFGLLSAIEFSAWPKTPELWIVVWAPLGSGILQIMAMLILLLATKNWSVLFKSKGNNG